MSVKMLLNRTFLESLRRTPAYDDFIRAPIQTTSITEAANRKKPKAQWKREQKRKWV